MTSYLDPYTLEEAIKEIRFSRKKIERLHHELAELRKAQGEPVGEVNRFDTGWVNWSGVVPADGTKLYTSAPPIPEGETK